MEEDIADLCDRLSLTEEEATDVVVRTHDIHATLERDRFFLIGKVLANRRINQVAFKNTMLKVWRLDTTINIIEVGFNMFLFEFATTGALEKVWDGQPWSFDQSLLCSNILMASLHLLLRCSSDVSMGASA